MRITKGDKYEEITEALKETGNFCPCVPPYMWKGDNGEDNPDWKCLCKQFLEQDELGHCHCRRYKKVED